MAGGWPSWSIPNIVRVHDLDFHDGRPYLVMEYIRGRTLAQYAREESVSPRQAAALVAEIAGAVAFAHRRGIVHQDIKPANVLIDEAGRPRLIDFGLAWQHDAWSDPSRCVGGGDVRLHGPRAGAGRARPGPAPVRRLRRRGPCSTSSLTGKGPFEAATPDGVVGTSPPLRLRPARP